MNRIPPAAIVSEAAKVNVTVLFEQVSVHKSALCDMVAAVGCETPPDIC